MHVDNRCKGLFKYVCCFQTSPDNSKEYNLKNRDKRCLNCMNRSTPEAVVCSATQPSVQTYKATLIITTILQFKIEIPVKLCAAPLHAHQFWV